VPRFKAEAPDPKRHRGWYFCNTELDDSLKKFKTSEKWRCAIDNKKELLFCICTALRDACSLRFNQNPDFLGTKSALVLAKKAKPKPKKKARKRTKKKVEYVGDPDEHDDDDEYVGDPDEVDDNEIVGDPDEEVEDSGSDYSLNKKTKKKGKKKGKPKPRARTGGKAKPRATGGKAKPRATGKAKSKVAADAKKANPSAAAGGKAKNRAAMAVSQPMGKAKTKAGGVALDSTEEYLDPAVLQTQEQCAEVKYKSNPDNGWTFCRYDETQGYMGRIPSSCRNV
jgi:hypothetical protein